MSSHNSCPSCPQSHFHDRHPSNLYQRPLSERFLDPGVLLPAVLILVAILYNSGYPQTIAPPAVVARRLWDWIVVLIPARLLFAIDGWINPVPMTRSMLFVPPGNHEPKSEALKRILGFGPRGRRIAESVAYASGVSISRLVAKRNLGRPAGLGNRSNSCYQNSILQGLASLEPFREYLAKIVSEREYTLPKIYATKALAGLVEELYSTEENGMTLWTPAVLKSMSTLQQQDAQEYFSRLLNEVEEELQKALKSTHRLSGFAVDSPKDETAASQHSDDSGYQSIGASSKDLLERTLSLRNPLEGLVSQQVACTVCNQSSGWRLYAFHCLTLNPGHNHKEHSLSAMLDKFTEAEQIEGVICGSCTLLKCREKIKTLVRILRSRGAEENGTLKAPLERLAAVEAAIENDDFEEKTLIEKCGITPKLRVQSTKSKQVCIARAPASIAFHMNRSLYDETTGHTFKNTSAVRFPMLLDLGPWCAGSAVSSTTPSDEEQWHVPAQQSMVPGSQAQAKLAGPFYELRAVITHYGLHENGHYVCYRKHPVAQHKSESGELLGTKKKQGPANLASEDEHVLDDDVQSTTEETPPLLYQDPCMEGDGGHQEARWWRLSDQDVTPVDEAVVLAQSGVFMLFYDCVDPNRVLVSDEDNSEPPESDGGSDIVAADDPVLGEAPLESTALGSDTPDGPSISVEPVATSLTEGGPKAGLVGEPAGIPTLPDSEEQPDIAAGSITEGDILKTAVSAPPSPGGNDKDA